MMKGYEKSCDISTKMLGAMMNFLVRKKLWCIMEQVCKHI